MQSVLYMMLVAGWSVAAVPNPPSQSESASNLEELVWRVHARPPKPGEWTDELQVAWHARMQLDQVLVPRISWKDLQSSCRGLLRDDPATLEVMKALFEVYDAAVVQILSEAYRIRPLEHDRMDALAIHWEGLDAAFEQLFADLAVLQTDSKGSRTLHDARRALLLAFFQPSHGYDSFHRAGDGVDPSAILIDLAESNPEIGQALDGRLGAAVAAFREELDGQLLAELHEYRAALARHLASSAQESDHLAAWQRDRRRWRTQYTRAELFRDSVREILRADCGQELATVWENRWNADMFPAIHQHDASGIVQWIAERDLNEAESSACAYAIELYETHLSTLQAEWRRRIVFARTSRCPHDTSDDEREFEWNDFGWRRQLDTGRNLPIRNYSDQWLADHGECQRRLLRSLSRTISESHWETLQRVLTLPKEYRTSTGRFKED